MSTQVLSYSHTANRFPGCSAFKIGFLGDPSQCFDGSLFKHYAMIRISRVFNSFQKCSTSFFFSRWTEYLPVSGVSMPCFLCALLHSNRWSTCGFCSPPRYNYKSCCAPEYKSSTSWCAALFLHSTQRVTLASRYSPTVCSPSDCSSLIFPTQVSSLQHQLCSRYTFPSGGAL
eukprot:Gb_40509 [translate_table: standard]